MLVRDLKGFAPLFHVSKPIDRSVRVQPAIGCDAVNDDRVIAKNAPEKLDVLGVESVDVSIDQGLDFARGLSATVILQSCLASGGVAHQTAIPTSLASKGIADGHGVSIPAR